MAKARIAYGRTLKLTPLKDHLVEQGLIDEPAEWKELSGGRTNKVWKVTQNNSIEVCVKLYPKNNWGNPLFPNDPEVEFACLTKFHTSNLCPKPIALSNSPLGRCVLYQHLSGPWLENEFDAAAKTLAILHNMPLLVALRQSPMGSDQIMAHAHEILKNCPAKKAKDLVDLQPDSQVQANGSYAIIHTDPVPANIILSNGTAKLIDWQCPAIGSPQEDLCHFLSPAMQWLYRGTSLTDQDRQDFLHSYHDHNPNVEKVFLNAIQPWYTWRMACYCLWQIGQGRFAYKKPLELELEYLKESH